MFGTTRIAFVRVTVLLILCQCVTSLIIPEDIPTVLSLIYSYIPPIKKGTDSRIGVGFRLGEHADFQVLFELGPQTETEPIGNSATKKRRDAMLSAAMRGDLGPLAQAVAKYQTERRIQKELEKIKVLQEKLKKAGIVKNQNDKTNSTEWLEKWSGEMKQETKQSEDQVPSEQIPVERIIINMPDKKPIQERIGRPSNLQNDRNIVEQLTELYKLQTEKTSA